MTNYDDDPEEYEDEPEDEGDPEPEDVQEPEEPEEPEPKARKKPTREASVTIPIGEAVTAESMHGVVAFTRSINLGERDHNAHYRVEMPFVVQPGWTPAQGAASAADAFYQAKAVVLEQAGLEFSIDESGVLHEAVRKTFPKAEKQRPNERRMRAVREEEEDEGDEEQTNGHHPAGRTRGTGGMMHPADMDRPKHISQGLWLDLCEGLGDTWYDNRPRKESGEYKSTAADFVRADDRKSIWLKPFRQPGQRAGARRGGYDD